MLPRAALRAFAPSAVPSPTLSAPLRLPCSFPSPAYRIRTFASGKRPPPPRPLTSQRPSRQPPTPAPRQAPRQTPPGPVGSTQQTSPGTSIPKDETWKRQDGIKFGGSAASTPLASSGVKTPIEGARPTDATIMRESPLESETTPQMPKAQQFDADEPLPGSARETAHNAQAAAENSQPPPLPDLRQGIPSTFDLEFGAGSKSQSQAPGDHQSHEAEKGAAFDLTSSPEPGEQAHGRGERDHDRSAYETSYDRRRARAHNYLYASILFLSLTGGFYLARPFHTSDDVPSHLDPEFVSSWSPSAMYARVRARFGSQLGYYTEPTFPKLLPDMPEAQRLPYTLVLSLEDLMIHSTWDRTHGYRTAKRPGIDYFIRYLSQYYELVLFTSAPRMMADPVMQKLDPYHIVMWNLGREATKYEGGEYVKDLSYLNRDLSKTLIIDTHAPHVKNQPENAIILPKWTGDPKDPHVKDLVALIPFLEYIGTMGVQDVREVLKSFAGQDIPAEFARREAAARERFLGQLEQEKSRKPRLSLGSLAGGLGIKGSPAGGMVLGDGSTSVAEGLAQGKMLSDQIREHGQRQYEAMEKQIREHGAQWLKEEEEEQKKMMEAEMKKMKKGAFSWFGGGGGDTQ